jgi:hypothetical protein
LAFGLWPYYHLYRLDRALAQNDRNTLMVLIDLDAIREDRRSRPPPVDTTHNPVTQAFSQVANVLTGKDLDSTITLDWVRETLRPVPPRPDETYPSVLHYTTCAFFENFQQFVARIRDLGEKPIHVRWKLHDWTWRVSAIYEPN